MSAGNRKRVDGVEFADGVSLEGVSSEISLAFLVLAVCWRDLHYGSVKLSITSVSPRRIEFRDPAPLGAQTEIMVKMLKRRLTKEFHVKQEGRMISIEFIEKKR